MHARRATYHLRTLSIICGQLQLGRGNCACQQGWAAAHLVFASARKTAGLLVTQGGCRFLDGKTVAQEFQGVVLALLRQPDLGVHAHLLEEISVQCARGNVAQFRQCRGRPLSLPRKFGPVLDMLQFGIHKRFNCNWFVSNGCSKNRFTLQPREDSPAHSFNQGAAFAARGVRSLDLVHTHGQN